MRHFLFEEKEYRIRASFRRRRDTRDSAAELARIIRRPGSKRRSGGGRAAPPRADLRQKCVAKMQYSKSIEAHRVQLEKYLAREGTGIDGGAAKLFGTDTEEYRKNMADKNFRIFLSPQKSGVDLEALAGKFVKKLELQTGYRFFWKGACHYNTAHPHAHLLINGVDKLGREIDIPKDVVKTFMREAAMDLCTAQLGKRTERDLEIEREAELASPRFTRLDGRIAELCGGTFRPDLGGERKEKDRLLARLDHLRKMNLCAFEGGGYKLKAGWEEDLRANGRYGVFLKAREALRRSTPASLRVYTGEAGEVSGEVTKIYRPDGDASDHHVAVIEGLDGRSWFVPLFRKPELRDGKEKKALREGEMVTLKTYETQKGRLTPFIFKMDINRARKGIRLEGQGR